MITFEVFFFLIKFGMFIMNSLRKIDQVQWIIFVNQSIIEIIEIPGKQEMGVYMYCYKLIVHSKSAYSCHRPDQ